MSVARIDCARAQEAAHRRLDGETLAPDDAARLEEHVGVCAGCRAAVAELAAIQAALREVPVPGLPAAALDRLLDRTSRAAPARRAWRVAAAAAVAALAVGTLWWTLAPREDARVASAAEVQRATAEARLVLAVAASALSRAERAAIDEGLARGVGRALDRTTIRWSGVPPARPPKGGNGV